MFLFKIKDLFAQESVILETVSVESGMVLVVI